MSYLPENSRIKLDQGSADAISKMGSTTEIMEYLHAQAIAQGHVVPEPPGFDQNILHEVEPPTATAPTEHAKVITINGQQYRLTGETPEALEAAELNLLKTLVPSNNRTEEPAATAMSDDDQTRLARNAELQLKMQRGEISMQQYIEQSGAIDEYLASRGLSVDALRSASEKAYVQSWADATEEFLAKAGAEWPGGRKNLDTAISIMQANPELADAADKVAALTQVFEYMKANNLLDTSEVEQRKAISEAMASGNSFDEIKSAALRSVGRSPESDYNVRTWHQNS